MISNIDKSLPKDQIELIGIFRHKYKRLSELSQSQDAHDLIECGGLIRDLIISDGNGLAGTIFRTIPTLRTKKHTKIKFYAAICLEHPIYMILI